jgi:hypothetical protein
MNSRATSTEMSLINEALKRAKQVQARTNAAARSLPPLEPAVPLPSGPALPNWILAASGIALLGVACCFLWLWWRNSNRQLAAADSRASARAAFASTPTTAPLTNPTALKKAAASPLPKAAVAANPPAIKAAPRATVTPSPPPVNADASMAATPPALAASSPDPHPALELKTNEAALEEATTTSLLASFKVQGIFYRGPKSSTLINGQTLFIGDELDGAKVVGIERRQVRLLVAGHTHVLKLY